MKSKLVGLTVGLISVYALLVAPTASAAQTVSLDVKVEDGIAWVDAGAEGSVAELKTKIMAPGPGKTRSLWQTCRFDASEAGTYRCGIDIADGSLARKTDGTWVAKLFTGGVQVARKTFTF